MPRKINPRRTDAEREKERLRKRAEREAKNSTAPVSDSIPSTPPEDRPLLVDMAPTDAGSTGDGPNAVAVSAPIPVPSEKEVVTSQLARSLSATFKSANPNLERVGIAPLAEAECETLGGVWAPVVYEWMHTEISPTKLALMTSAMVLGPRVLGVAPRVYKWAKEKRQA